MSRPAGARAVLAVGIPVALAAALAAFGALLAPGSVARAAGTAPSGPRKVLVVLVDRTTASTIAPTSSGQQLDSLGASGLMTTATGRGAGGDSPYAPVLSLSAGAPAVAPAGFHAADASAGTPAFADMGALRAANAAAGVAAIPGLLGQTLEDHGIRTAAVGDSSLPGHPFAPAFALAMDEQGRVPAGRATSTDEPQSVGPVPVRVDLAALEAATKQALASARFVVVDWGDTYRIDRIFQEHAGGLDEPGADGITLRSRLTAARTGSLRRLDVYMRFVQSELDLQHSIVVMVSPSPPSAAAGGTGMNLAPIVVAGGGITHGALSSRTTRSNGFVSNEDLAPAVLTWFGSSRALPDARPLLLGRAGGFRADHRDRERPPAQPDAPPANARAVDRRGPVGDRRRPLAPAPGTPAPAHQPARAHRGPPPRSRSGRRPAAPAGFDDDLRWLEILARWALFAAAILPLMFLLQPLLSTGSTPVALLEVTGAALVLGCLLSLAARKRAANGLGAIGILTVLAIVGDAATGQWLAVRSMVGPSIVEGRTLHGLGPILGGAAVAAALLAAGALARATRATRWLRLAWIALTGVVLILLSLPWMGGTTVAPAAGLVGLVTLAAAAERRPPGRRVWSAAAAALVVALVVLGGVLLAADVSFAQTAAASDGGSLGAAGAAASLTGHAVLAWAGLLAVSAWTPLFVTSVAALLFVDGRLRRGPWAESARGRALQPADRHARATVAGMAAAAAVALVSGAAGAATATVVLMGAAVLACAAAIERARPVPR